jgi:transcription elongation factor SPT6
VGDYIFRPSSRGANNLTLTWKFYTNNISHIDIVEHQKLPNTSIGSRLSIGEESFDNLQEIVERYILPCNRAIKEIFHHPKFVKCKDVAELKNTLQQEKNEDNTRIPYRFTILEQYP